MTTMNMRRITAFLLVMIMMITSLPLSLAEDAVNGLIPAEQTAEVLPAENTDSETASGAEEQDDSMPVDTYSILEGEAALAAMDTADALLRAPGVPAALNNASVAVEGDGSKIESVIIRWLTPDDTVESSSIAPYQDHNPGVPGDDNLYLAPRTDLAQKMQFQVDIALSGQYDYDVGEVQLVIPAQIVKLRDGTDLTGTMTLSVPEAPSQNADFNYIRVGDHYIITNTRRLSAATKAMFQFTYRDIIPHTIQDMVESDLKVTLNVTTHLGNTLTKDSNQLTATIDTYAAVTSSYKGGDLFTVRPDSLSDALLRNLPGATADMTAAELANLASEYVFVRWYAYVYHVANQEFSIQVEDAALKAHEQAPYEANEIDGYMLGVDGKDVNGQEIAVAGNAVSYTIMENGYHADTMGRYDHVQYLWTAYKKSDFEDFHVYEMPNSTTWTLTERDAATGTDAQEVTTHTSSSLVRYTPQRFRKPIGHFDVDKWTEQHYTKNWTYGYALNQLKDLNQDALMTFLIESTGYGMPWTYENKFGGLPEQDENGNTVEGNPWDNIANFGHHDYSMVTEDNRTWYHTRMQGEQLTSEDFDIVSVRFVPITMFRYDEKVSTGAWGYVADKDLPKASIQVWGKKDAAPIEPSPANGVNSTYVVDAYDRAAWEADGWVQYGVVNYTQPGNSQVITGMNGGTAEGDHLALPANVTDLRTVVTTRLPGVEYDMYPTIRLKYSSQKVQDYLAEVFAESDEPTDYFDNAVSMSAYELPTADTSEYIVTIHDSSMATLGAAAYGVHAYKNLKNTENDPENRRVLLTYNSNVTEQSNLTDREEYDSAVELGVIPAETGGVWYDLLPPNVHPILDTVRTVRSGDSIRTGYPRVIRNYKGSSRDLLIVGMDLTPAPTQIAGYWSDVPEFTFQAFYTWDDMRNLGKEVTNYVAFETDNLDNRFGTVKGAQGEPDEPLQKNGRNSTTPQNLSEEVVNLLTELDPNSDPSLNRFVYAQSKDMVNVDVYQTAELWKRVRSEAEGIWTTGLSDAAVQVNVYEGQAYSYLLRTEPSADTKQKDIRLMDALENYTPVNGATATQTEDFAHISERSSWNGVWLEKGQWRGTLEGFDLSTLAAYNIKPVIYYNTDPAFVFDDTISPEDYEHDDMRHKFFSEGTYDFNNTSIWRRLDVASGTPYVSVEDLQVPAGQQVHAFMVDCSKRMGANGQLEDFILEPNETLSLVVNMRAPIGDNALSAYSHLEGNTGSTAVTDAQINWEAALDPQNNMRAYNNVRMLCTMLREGHPSTDTLVRYDYVRVGIMPMNLKVEKAWDDAFKGIEDYDRVRPDHVIVHLCARVYKANTNLVLYEGRVGGYAYLDHLSDAVKAPVRLDDSNGWKAQFNHLSAEDSEGNQVTYYLEEEEIPMPAGFTHGYTAIVSSHPEDDDNMSYLITNKREPEIADLSGEKVWDDEEDEEGLRPAYVTVHLYADGVREKTITVYPDSMGRWKYHFAGMPKYRGDDDRTPIEYTVKEEYVPKYEGISTDVKTLVNTHVPVGDLCIQKEVLQADTLDPDTANLPFTFTVVFMREPYLDEATGEMVENAPYVEETPYYIVDKDAPFDPENPGTPAGVLRDSNSLTFRMTRNQRFYVVGLPSETVYQITEEPLDGFKLTSSARTFGQIRAGHTNMVTAQFNNRYTATGEAYLRVAKQLTGRETIGMTPFQFRFTAQLTAINGQPVENGKVYNGANSAAPATGKGGAPVQGDVSFNAIKYNQTDAGKTFTYVISELQRTDRPEYTYDVTALPEEARTVTVKVLDNHNGTLTTVTTYPGGGTETWPGGSQLALAELPLFENEYKAEGGLTVKAWKLLDGRPLKDGEFTFVIEAQNGGPLPANTQTTNNVEGEVIFDSISFTQEHVTGADGEPWTYIIREVKGTDNTVIYTDYAFAYHVRVLDNGDGSLSFMTSNQHADINYDHVVCPICNGMGISALQNGEGIAVTFVEYDANQYSMDVPNDWQVTQEESWQGEKRTRYFNVPYSGSPLRICRECNGSGRRSNGNNCLSCRATGLQNGNATVVFDLLGIDVSGYNVSNYTLGASNETKEGIIQKGLRPYFPVTKDGVLNMFTFTLNIPVTECAVCRGTGEVEEIGGYTITGDPVVPLFVNELEPGKLTLTKTVEGENAPDQEFTFKITVNSEKLDTANISYGADIKHTPTINPDLKPEPTPYPYGMSAHQWRRETPIPFEAGSTNGYEYADEDGWVTSPWESVRWRVDNGVLRVAAKENSDGALGTVFFAENGDLSWRNEAFRNKINHIVIEDGVTASNLDFAFNNMECVLDIEFPEGFAKHITSMNGTFRGMSSLKSLDLSGWSSDAPVNFARPTGYGYVYTDNDDFSVIEEISFKDWDIEARKVTDWGDREYYKYEILQMPESIQRITFPSFNGDVEKLMHFALWIAVDNQSWFSGIYDNHNWYDVDEPDRRIDGYSLYYLRTNSGYMPEEPPEVLRVIRPNSTWERAKKYGTVTYSDNVGGNIITTEQQMWYGESYLRLPMTAEEVGLSGHAKLKGWKVTSLKITRDGQSVSQYWDNALGKRVDMVREVEPGEHLYLRINQSNSTSYMFNSWIEGKSDLLVEPIWGAENVSVKVDSSDSIGYVPDMTLVEDQGTLADLLSALPDSGLLWKYGHNQNGWKVYDNDGEDVTDRIDSIVNDGTANGPYTVKPVWEKAPEGSYTQNELTFTQTLRAGDTITLDGLPAGATFQIWEETPAGWVLVDMVNAGGTIQAKEEVISKFTNRYEPNVVQTWLRASKYLDGKIAKEAGKYTFALLDSNGAQIATAQNDAGGMVIFPALTFDGVGIYNYTIQEVAGTDPTIAYDDTQVHVTVRVSPDAETGMLAVEGPYYTDNTGADIGQARFDNRTQPGELTVKKIGQNMTSDAQDTEFSIKVRFRNQYGEMLTEEQIQQLLQSKFTKTEAPQAAGNNSNAARPLSMRGAPMRAPGSGSGKYHVDEDGWTEEQMANTAAFLWISPDKTQAAFFRADKDAKMSDDGIVRDLDGNPYTGYSIYKINEGQADSSVEAFEWLLEAGQTEFDWLKRTRWEDLIPTTVTSIRTDAPVRPVCAKNWHINVDQIGQLKIDTSKCENLSIILQGNGSAEQNADLSSWDTSNVKIGSVSGNGFTSLNLSEWDLSNATGFSLNTRNLKEINLSSVKWIANLPRDAYWDDLQKIIVDSSTELPANLFIRSAWGKAFYDEDAGKDIYCGGWINGDDMSDGTILTAQELKMSGTWERNIISHKLQWDLDGGTLVGGATPAVQTQYDAVVLPDASQMYRQDYDFVGWQKKAVYPTYSGNSVTQEGGAELPWNNYNVDTSYIELKALWKPTEGGYSVVVEHRYQGGSNAHTEYITVRGLTIGQRDVYFYARPQGYYKLVSKSGNHGWYYWEPFVKLASITGNPRTDAVYFEYQIPTYDLIYSSNPAQGGEGVENTQYSLRPGENVTLKSVADVGFTNSEGRPFLGWKVTEQGQPVEKYPYIYPAGSIVKDWFNEKSYDVSDWVGPYYSRAYTLLAQWGETDEPLFDAADVSFTVKLKPGESGTFADLPAGIYWEIEEVTPLPNGWTYVTGENETGKILPNGDHQASVTNRYDAKGSVPLDVAKVMNGGEAKEGAFSFTLTPKADGLQAGQRPGKMPGGAASVTVTNGAVDAVEQIPNPESGTADYIDNPNFNKSVARLGVVEFTLADLQQTTPIDETKLQNSRATYVYTLVENPGDDPAVEYDRQVKTVLVDVADDGTGNLKTTVRYEATAAEGGTATGDNTFTNRYKDAALKVQKTVTGTDAEQEFTFLLTLASEDGEPIVGSFTGLTATQTPGEYTFTVTGGKTVSLTGLPHNATYTVTEPENMLPNGYTLVNVDGDAEGTLNGALEEEDWPQVTFTNEYEATGSLQLTATKLLHTLDENTLPAQSDDAIVALWINSRKEAYLEAQRAAWRAQYPLDHAGEEWAAEKLPEDVENAILASWTAEMEENALAELTDEKKEELRGSVQLDFWFELLDENGRRVGDRVASDGNGKVILPALHFDSQDVGRKTYTLFERGAAHGETELEGYTYDNTVYTITVTVTDNGDGTLGTSWTAESRRELEDGSTEIGLANQFTFDNRYTAKGSLLLEAAKVLEGAKLHNLQFAFKLKGELVSGGNPGERVPMPAPRTGRTGEDRYTVDNDKDGLASFGQIAFNESHIGRTYRYTLQEVIPEEKAPGMTYDTHVKVWTVTVENAGNNLLRFVDENGNELEAMETEGEYRLRETFTNRYEAKGKATLEAGKLLTGREWKENESFAFVLKGEGQDAVIREATRTENAKWELDCLLNGDNADTFTVDSNNGRRFREYAYTLEEVQKGKTIEGLRYDAGTWQVTVRVEDCENGTLETTVTYKDSTGAEQTLAVFKNEYVAEPAKVQLQAVKKMENRKKPLAENEFTFELLNAEKEPVLDADNVPIRAQNDAQGLVQFPVLTFTQEELKNSPYTYYIREVPGDQAHVIRYDEHMVKATVTLTDDGKGQIVAITEYEGDTTFVNTFNPGTTQLTGTKIWLDGKQKHDNTVEVELHLWRVNAAGEAEEMTGVQPAWMGNIYSFAGLDKYDEDGHAYTYSVTETPVKGYAAPEYSDGDRALNEGTITNRITGKTELKGAKVWIDGKREHDNAAELTLTLKRVSAREGSEEETVDAIPAWTDNAYAFTDLEKYDAEGYEYTYSVTETPVEGYAAPVYSDGDRALDNGTIINRVVGTVKLSGTKVWVDGGKKHNNADDVQLALKRVSSKAGAVEETLEGEEPTWQEDTYTFAELTRYDVEGYEYTYYVTETQAEGYEAPIYSDTYYALDGGKITNIVTGMTEISGKKIWMDGNKPHDNAREITLILTRKLDREGAETETLDLTPVWEGDTYTFSNLPKYDEAGYAYLYDVNEEPVAGYEKPVKNGTNFMNKIIPPTPTVTVTPQPAVTPVPNEFYFSFKKEWRGTPQEDITFTLYNPNGTVRQHRFDKRQISATEWIYEAWISTAADYYVIEAPMDGYTTVYRNVGEHRGETSRVYNGGTIINSGVPRTGDTRNTVLWTGLTGASLLGMAAVALMARKKRKNGHA